MTKRVFVISSQMLPFSRLKYVQGAKFRRLATVMKEEFAGWKLELSKEQGMGDYL